MSEDLEERLRAHYRARDPGPAPEELRRRVSATLAAERRNSGSGRGRVLGFPRAHPAALGSLAAVLLLVAAAAFVLVARPWAEPDGAPVALLQHRTPAAHPSPSQTS